VQAFASTPAPSPFAAPARRAVWRSDRWGTLRCRAVRDETADVRTFVLAPDDGARIAFEPGQFLTVRTADGTERSYTLSSSAAADRAVTITVKRKPGGAVSGHLFDTLLPGETIEALGPAGVFGPARLPAEAYALVSAGSGITPMLSVVRTAADLGIDMDAVFVHAARTPEDFVAADELAVLARRLPRLRLAFVPSRPDAHWPGPRGRLDGDTLARLVPDLPRRAVLTCGPEGFMATMREAARTLGVPPERYAQESFTFGTADDAAAADTGEPARRITFARSGRSFDCPAGTTILSAAKAAGLAMPSSCAQGICGTCKSFKVSGKVTMGPQSALRQREIDRGFILPCSCRPETDVVIDR
jgi:3-phenylpropionate/trans-cinnamate dioxygenase ferredoxin reductase subunit